MDSKQDVTIEPLVSLSLAKCLLRISRVTAGTWQVAGTTLSSGSLRDGLSRHRFSGQAAAVYFNLKGISPMTAILLADAADLECISKCFTGHSFPRSGAITPAEEIMLSELGNIVLNSLMNGLINALKKSSIPAVPLFAHGGLDDILRDISRQVNPNQIFRLVSSVINLKSDKAMAKVEVMVLLPEELAMELELMRPTLGN
jgi:hypothetical protein